MSDEPTFDGITAAAVENLLQLTRWTNSAADVLGCTSPKLTTYTVPSKRKLEQIAKAVGRKPHILRIWIPKSAQSLITTSSFSTSRGGVRNGL